MTDREKEFIGCYEAHFGPWPVIGKLQAQLPWYEFINSEPLVDAKELMEGLARSWSSKWRQPHLADLKRYYWDEMRDMRTTVVDSAEEEPAMTWDEFKKWQKGQEEVPF